MDQAMDDLRRSARLHTLLRGGIPIRPGQRAKRSREIYRLLNRREQRAYQRAMRHGGAGLDPSCSDPEMRNAWLAYFARLFDHTRVERVT